MPEFKVKFKYENGLANDGKLDLYNGAASLSGISRSITIATHALINGEIRTRGDMAKGASFYLHAPRRGCFIFEAGVFIAGACSSGMFYDFVKYAFTEAVGKLDEMVNPPRPSVQKRIEPTVGELPAILEPSLIDVHRPIKKSPEMTLAVTKPRGELLVKFDAETESYLHPRDVVMPDPIICNVTRYNTLSRWGKLYDRSENRVISFFLVPELSEKERALITWSLHQSNLNREGTLYLKANAIVSANDRIKRYQVVKVSNQPMP